MKNVESRTKISPYTFNGVEFRDPGNGPLDPGDGGSDEGPISPGDTGAPGVVYQTERASQARN